METIAPSPNAPLILVADDVSGERRAAVRPAPRARLSRHRRLRRSVGAGCLLRAAPDLCILDVSMPAGDLGVDDRSTGFEVCRRIKRDPRMKSIPVIFVTALNDTTDRVKAIEAGGDDFLTKPHNRLVLGARVRSLLKLKAATDALEESLRKLRELEKMRDDLMKMIVHDLKTPLRLEALDMAKKLAHDSAARVLMDLCSPLFADHATARCLFSLLVSLHFDTGRMTRGDRVI